MSQPSTGNFSTSYTPFGLLHVIPGTLGHFRGSNPVRLMLIMTTTPCRRQLTMCHNKIGQGYVTVPHLICHHQRLGDQRGEDRSAAKQL